MAARFSEANLGSKFREMFKTNLADFSETRVRVMQQLFKWSIVLLAAGIVMVQMLPFFDLVAHAQRDKNYGTSF